MLDNEPTDHQSTTTEQDARENAPATGETGTAHASAADAAAPAKKTARKRAAKKTAAPPPPDPGSTDATGGAADGAPEPVRTSRRTRKATKKAADPATAALPDGSAAEATDAPAKKATRKRASKRATAAAASTVTEPVAEPTEPATDPQAATEPEEQRTAVPGIAVLFQAPEVDVEAPRRRRAASRPAGPPRAVEETSTDASDDGEDLGDTSAAQARGDEAASGTSEDQDSGEDGDGDKSRRRRRRGGRGRRKRADAADATDGEDGSENSEAPSVSTDGSAGAAPTADESDAPEVPSTAGDEAAGSGRRRRSGRGRASEETSEGQDASAGDSSGEGAGDSASEEADDEGEGSSSSRRRRRRRRRGAGEDAAEAPSPDDPPNTVVRVRQARKSATKDLAKDVAKDEVVGVKGSTRLEAKRQRRREGRETGRRKQVITESEFLARREAVERTMLVREQEGRTQIAVLEDGVLVEHYVARKAAASMIGNVYLGKVQNVLPSMEAAFVDIGKGRNAVLYAGEVNWDAAGMEGKPRRIELALKSGDPVLVQVSKDPVGSKGSRLTSQISLPGRYLVYVPNSSMTGISRKLPDTERARLKKILKAVVPDHAGVIVRTAAEGTSEVELERDVTRLQKRWADIEKRAKAANPPNMLHAEPDLTVKVIRDVFNEDFSSLVVTGDEAWETVRQYVDEVAPDLAERVSQWDGDKDLFAHHRVDEQIAKALERKVYLPSGGSLVIDRTEAMTVVDVNTGKFVGSGGNLEETVTRNNLEAAEEIVRQLRLRDVGGIIVIDFIDMVLESNRDLVLRRLLECLGRDRTKHQVAEVTSLGLVQMTRKRVGQGLLEAFSEPCEHCQGHGVVLFDEPVDRQVVDDGGGGRGGRGGASSNREQAPKKGPSQAQAVHEAARKAQEKAALAKLAQETAQETAQQNAPDGQPVQPAPDGEVEVAPAGAETFSVVEPDAAEAVPEAEAEAEAVPEAEPDAVQPAPEVEPDAVASAPEVEPAAVERAPMVEPVVVEPVVVEPVVVQPVSRPRRSRRATSPSTTPAPAPPA